MKTSYEQVLERLSIPEDYHRNRNYIETRGGSKIWWDEGLNLQHSAP